MGTLRKWPSAPRKFKFFAHENEGQPGQGTYTYNPNTRQAKAGLLDDLASLAVEWGPDSKLSKQTPTTNFVFEYKESPLFLLVGQ